MFCFDKCVTFKQSMKGPEERVKAKPCMWSNHSLISDTTDGSPQALPGVVLECKARNKF